MIVGVDGYGKSALKSLVINNVPIPVSSFYIVFPCERTMESVKTVQSILASFPSKGTDSPKKRADECPHLHLRHIVWIIKFCILWLYWPGDDRLVGLRQRQRGGRFMVHCTFSYFAQDERLNGPCKECKSGFGSPATNVMIVLIWNFDEGRFAIWNDNGSDTPNQVQEHERIRVDYDALFSFIANFRTD